MLQELEAICQPTWHYHVVIPSQFIEVSQQLYLEKSLIGNSSQTSLFINNLYISTFMITYVCFLCILSVLGSVQKESIAQVSYHFATSQHVIVEYMSVYGRSHILKTYKCYNSAFLFWHLLFFFLLNKPRQTEHYQTHASKSETNFADSYFF